MIGFVVAGVILGALARVLRHDGEDPGLAQVLLVGVVGAVVGGVGLNLVWGQPWADHTIYGFAGAIVLAVVLLGLFEGRVGRRPSA